MKTLEQPTIDPNNAVTGPAPATLSFEEARAAVRGLAPRIKEEAAETEHRTYHSAALHQELYSAGIYHLMRPRMFGGYEFSAQQFLTLARDLARADMATGWCITLASAHNLQFASWWPESVQREVYEAPYFAAAMTAEPGGVLTRVPGGFRLTGTHRYGSGTPYSTHFMGHARHDDRPGLSTFLAPRASYQILDDWGRNIGLRGSGSNSLRFDDAFLPADWVLEGVDQTRIDVSEGTVGLRLHNNPIYAAGPLSFFGTELTALAVGGALGAFDLYEELMPEKRLTLPPFATRSEDSDYLGRMGMAAAMLEGSVAIIDRAAGLYDEVSLRAVETGGSFATRDDLRIHSLAQQAGNLAWQAVQDILFRTAGSSAAASGSRFERSWRDLSAYWGHINNIHRDFVARNHAALRLADGAPPLGW